MLDVRLHKDFKNRFLSLRSETQHAILETLRKLSEESELEPDIRVDNEQVGKVGIIFFQENHVVAYAIEYAETRPILGEPRRTPLRIIATLAPAGGELTVLNPRD
jgi:hypothetical protein